MPTKTEKDDRGAEILVTNGFGKIKSVQWPEEGKKNAHVEIDADGLRIGVKGWADTTDPEIHEVLTALPDRVEFRIETHRDTDLDPAIPIADVDKFKKFRRMVTLKRATSGAPSGTISGNGSGSRADSGASSDVSGNREIPNEPPPIPGPKANDGPAAPREVKSGGDLTDTWAFAATLGMAELAFELLVQAGPDKATVTNARVKALAARFLAAADAGQLCVRDEVNRNANSHTRARGALRSALGLYPVPFPEATVTPEEAEAELDAWQARMSRAVCLLMTVGLELLHEG